MSIKAYWLGDNIIAALSPDDALTVIEQHEPPGIWRADQVRELTADELAKPVDDSAPVVVADELARSGVSRLLRWSYPA